MKFLLTVIFSIDTTGVIDRVKTLFVGNPDLVEGFNHFLPAPLKIHHTEARKDEAVYARERTENKFTGNDDSDRRNEDFDQARTYVKKIKQRFHSQPHIYKAFLDILHAFSEDQQSTQDIYEKVSILFKDHEDLLREFSNFLPEAAPQDQEEVNIPKLRPTRSRAMQSQEKSQTPKAPPVAPGSCATFDELQIFFKIKHHLRKNEYADFLKIISLYNQDIILKKELFFLVKNLIKGIEEEGLFESFASFIGVDPNEDMQGLYVDEEGNEEDRMNDTIEENFENPFEDILFNCETHLSELDNAIESNLLSLKYFEDILAAYNKLSDEEKKYFVVDNVDPLYLESIKLLYKRRGDEIINALLTTKSINIINIIVERMRAKETEWNESRKDWHNLRQKILEHYNKCTFDHQSNRFKEDEKKRLEVDTILKVLKDKDLSSPISVVDSVSTKERVEIVKRLLKVVGITIDNSVFDSFLVNLLGIREDEGQMSIDDNDIISDFVGNEAFFLFLSYVNVVLRSLSEAEKLSSEKESTDKAPEGVALYEEFIQSVEKLLSKELDSAKFEAQCFNALGLHSFVLFTLDDAIRHLAEWYEKVLTPPNRELLDLYQTRGFTKDGFVTYINHFKDKSPEGLFVFSKNNDVLSISNHLEAIIADISREDKVASEVKETEAAPVSSESVKSDHSEPEGNAMELEDDEINKEETEIKEEPLQEPPVDEHTKEEKDVEIKSDPKEQVTKVSDDASSVNPISTDIKSHEPEESVPQELTIKTEEKPGQIEAPKEEVKKEEVVNDQEQKDEEKASSPTPQEDKPQGEN